jgi:hypothetical protein
MRLIEFRVGHEVVSNTGGGVVCISVYEEMHGPHHGHKTIAINWSGL